MRLAIAHLHRKTHGPQLVEVFLGHDLPAGEGAEVLGKRVQRLEVRVPTASNGFELKCRSVIGCPLGFLQAFEKGAADAGRNGMWVLAYQVDHCLSIHSRYLPSP